MPLTVLNFHSGGWNLQNYCVPQSEKFQIKSFCWTRLREEVAGFGILKIFLQLFCWGAVVPLCVATRTWYSAHLTAGDFLAALWKFIQNTTQSTGFWKTPVHKHTEEFLMPSRGRVTKAPGLRADRCPFQWLEPEHFKQVLAHLLGTAPISQMSRLIIWTLKLYVSVKIPGSGAIHWQCHLSSPQLLIPSLWPPSVVLVKLFMGPRDNLDPNPAPPHPQKSSDYF